MEYCTYEGELEDIGLKEEKGPSGCGMSTKKSMWGDGQGKNAYKHCMVHPKWNAVMFVNWIEEWGVVTGTVLE